MRGSVKTDSPLYRSKEGQIIIYGKNGLGEGIPTAFWIHKKK
jgi:hypothetical protein